MDKSLSIHVLGLGETLEDFQPDESITIGVNDIHSTVKTDYVVCVDSKKAFAKDRLKDIEGSKCKGFYSQLDEWSNIEKFQKMELAKVRGSLEEIDTDKFCYSICSPFVACVLAYKLGAKRIVLWGVDFMSHPKIKDSRRDRALKDFKALDIELRKKGVKMYVGDSLSYLSTFLPVWSRI